MVETILIVDDNRQISGFLAGSVLPSLGYEVLVAYTGRQGLDLIRQHHRLIDLILLDLQLPDTTGIDLLRTLEHENIYVPTILMTGHGSEQVAVDAFRLGVQDYLNKPVDTDILAKAIERALTISRLRRDREQLNARLKEQVEWLTTLSQVSKSLTSTLDIDTVLKRIVDAGVQLTKAQEGFLALVDTPSGQLHLRATKNIEENIIKTVRIPVTNSLTGSVLQTRHPLRKMLDDPNQPVKVSTGFLVYSLLHVPIFSKDEPIGVLSVDNRTNRQGFTANDEAILTSLADYAAVALENASLYDQTQKELNERRRIESALRESDERYALAMRGANDGLWDWDMRRNRIYFSPRWKAMLGYAENEIGDSPSEWMEHIHPADIEMVRRLLQTHLEGKSAHFESEHRMRQKDGRYLWVQVRGLAVQDGSGRVTRIAGSQTDISERKKSEERLIHDARYDNLTTLYNRAALVEQLRLSIERSRRHPDYLFAVLYMDLDRFKDVNDSQGHAVGDLLLKNIAQKLVTIIRPSDIAARLGGDEFVILLDGIHDIKDATIVAERIQTEIEQSMQQFHHRPRVTASIGLVLSQPGYKLPDEILRDADIAMYRAKSSGKARYEIFDPTMRERLIARLRMETELRHALEHQALNVYYQPVLSVADHKILGCEALARWRHPQRGMIPPKEFIPIAEEGGLIMGLDMWVLREACKQTREWQKTIPGAANIKVNVNFSGKHFTQTDLVERIKRVLQETDLSPHHLNLEITENVMMENHTLAIQLLGELQEIGVQIQVDDFGMGYSSLSYLSRFPLNALKIDQSFVSNMQQDSTNMKIIQAIVSMTHNLGMTVIAEGVETPAQFKRLEALGCECVQGYLVAMPLNSQQMFDLLTRAFSGPMEKEKESLS